MDERTILWNEEKNSLLLEQYGVGFGDVVLAMRAGHIVTSKSHPNRDRYPNQSIMVLWINDYPYVVPYIEDENSVFLKTLYPSRKWKRLLKERNET